jgi:hypothetical protein
LTKGGARNIVRDRTPYRIGAANPARKGVSPVKKMLGMVVLAVALLMPAQGIMAGEKEMKMMEDTEKKLEKTMKMMKEKKMKMTPDQEKAMMQKFDDFNKYLDSLLKQAG